MYPGPTITTCESCGSGISPDNPLGQCPRCLLNLGLPSDDFEIVDEAAFADSGKRPSDFDYELLEKIGRGGMGLVYRARQRSLNRTVAIKMMAAGVFATPLQLARFQREAETAAKLDHPNIVAIIEVGEHQATPFLVMRLVEGESLADQIRQFALPFQPKSTAEQAQLRIARLLATVARAVDYAHRRGVLHRDLKPSNILLDQEKNPHLTDFGIAKSLDQEGGITQTAEVLGTLNYMSPEQAAGKPLTRTADVYSLGAILYELLTGQPPFEGPKMEVLRHVLETDPVPPRVLAPTANRDLATICMKCLDKSANRRYSTALELAEDLERWMRHEPIVARRIGPVLRLQRWTMRNRVAATLLVSLSAGIFVSLLLLEQAREEQFRKSIALDILRAASARQLQDAWASASSSFSLKSEPLAAMAGMEVTTLTDSEERYSIALIARGNPLNRVLEAAPLLHEIERTMTDLSSTPVRMDLTLHKGSEGALDDLVHDRVDFAQLNAREFLRARELDPKVRPLITIPRTRGVDDFGVIFTRKETGITGLEGLRGRSLLLGPAGSTLSFWAKVSLMYGEVRANHLSRYRYVDESYDVVPAAKRVEGVELGNPFSAVTPVEAVIAGYYDAGVVTERRFREIAAEQNLVALARFPDNGDIVVGKGSLSEVAARAFQRALIRLNDLPSEEAANGTTARFRVTNENDYKEIQDRLDFEAAFEQ